MASTPSPNWLGPWSHCSCMCIPVHTPWLPDPLTPHKPLLYYQWLDRPCTLIHIFFPMSFSPDCEDLKIRNCVKCSQHDHISDTVNKIKHWQSDFWISGFINECFKDEWTYTFSSLVFKLSLHLPECLNVELLTVWSADKDAEQLELSYTTDEHANLYSHFGNSLAVSYRDV